MSILKDGEASILRLSVVMQGERVPVQNLTYVFGPEGGTVGRKDCTWTLEDTRDVLSRKHIEIRFRNDHYLIIDHSTNGTFINDSTQKLGLGVEHRIVDGDKIKIGEYLLLATLEPRSSESPGETDPDTAGIGPGVNHGAVSEQSIPSFLKEPKFGKISDLGHEGPDFARPPTWADEEGSSGEPIPPFSPDSSAHSGNQEDASILDYHMSPPGSVENHSGKPRGDEAAARLRDNPPTSFIPGGPEYQRFDEPEVIPSRAEMPELVPKDEHGMADGKLDTDIPIDQKGPFGETIGETEKVAKPEDVRERERTPIQPSISPIGGTEPGNPTVSEALDQDETGLFRAFLEGLGVPEWEVPEASREEYMRMMGEALQQAIQGLIQSLHLRDEFKKEFIVTRTVISPMHNNPLKYAVNVEDALSRAFLKTTSDAYLPIAEAIQQGFEDIAAHHIALVAGMQAAVSGLLGLFSPSELERDMSSVSFMERIIPQFKHARLWEAYLREYQAIVENAEEDFQDLLGKKFTKAYNEQVLALRSAEFGKAGREK